MDSAHMIPQLILSREEFVALDARHCPLRVDGAMGAQLAAGGEGAGTVGAGVQQQPFRGGVHQRHVPPVGCLVETLVTPAQINKLSQERESEQSLWAYSIG